MEERPPRLGRRADEEDQDDQPSDWLPKHSRRTGGAPIDPQGGDFEEEPVPYTSLPAPVRKAVEENLPGANGHDAIRMQLGEVVLYNIVAHRGRTGLGITLSPAGALIEMERDVAPSRLPKSIKDALESYYPGTEFNSAGIVTIQFYEFEYDDENGRRIVQMDAAGRILQDVDEADS